MGPRNIAGIAGHFPLDSDQGEKMAEHDAQRFERLYKQHFDAVAAYALSRADRALAEDAIARTFEIAWRRIADVPDDPLPWLLGVARRALADLRRGQSRQSALIERIAATVGEAQKDHAESLIDRRRVLDALARLTEPQREALLLVAWDGLSQREVATVLGCSRGAVAVRLHRARMRMRSTASELADGETELGAHPNSPQTRLHKQSSSPLIEETT